MNNIYLYLLNTMQFKQALGAAEREVYLKAYHYTNYNQTRTAKLLGVSRGTLRARLSEWGE